MGVSTFGKSLDAVVDFEERRSKFFKELSARATDPGTQLLASYLGNRTSPVVEVCGDYDTGEIAVIRATPILEENIGSNPGDYFDRARLGSEVDGAAVLDLAIAFEQTIVDTYRHVYEQPIGDKAIDFARSLYIVEVRHIKELKKMKALDYF